MENTENQKSFLTTRNIILAIIIILAIGGGLYFYNKINKDPNVIARNDFENTVESIGKLMILPEGETPVLATVTDPEKIKGESLFINSQVGDKVLFYQSSKKAILYRPSIDKIIEVSAIIPDPTPISNSQTKSTTKK